VSGADRTLAHVDAWDREQWSDISRYMHQLDWYRDHLEPGLAPDDRLDELGQQVFYYLTMRGMRARQAARQAMNGVLRQRRRVRDEMAAGYERDLMHRWRQLHPDLADPGLFDSQAPEQLAFWQSRLTSAEFVYFIQAGEHGPVKIGLSNKPQRRIGQLQTGNPDELILRHVVPGTRDLEGRLHHRFRPALIRGEWFGREYLPVILAFGGGLAEQMVRAYDGSGSAPVVAGTHVLGPRDLRAVRRRVLEGSKHLLRGEMLKYVDMSEEELDGHLRALLDEDLAPGEAQRVRQRLDPWDDWR
jgi:hypothetical protein